MHGFKLKTLYTLTKSLSKPIKKNGFFLSHKQLINIKVLKKLLSFAYFLSQNADNNMKY